MNDRAYGAERHFLELRGLPIGSSLFPEASFAALAAELGYRAASVRTLGDLTELRPALGAPDGPILVDCLIDPSVAAPFMTEFLEFERAW
jgi:thiamine pyrophosphate-dependent acetolactate synthase large subunit-like protein